MDADLAFTRFSRFIGWIGLRRRGQLMTRYTVLAAMLIIGFLCAASGGLIGVLGVLLGMLVSGAVVATGWSQEDVPSSGDSVPPLR